MRRFLLILVILFSICFFWSAVSAQKPALQLNELEYFEMPGTNVMVFQDIYPEGHQGGVNLIQNGVRVASNGDLRLEPTPGHKRHVWQPTLEYFLPVQMCHMRVEEQYRVWHGACHLDDARMAPVNYNHFDGYLQGSSTLTKSKPGITLPGLNVGGWHDAGYDDLRIESQADEVYILASAHEAFRVNYDETTIDQGKRLVRIHQPDGKTDLLQQVEQGI